MSKINIKRKIALVILDGWGLGAHDRSNPIYLANPKTIDFIKHNFPSTSLQASGIAVGLPWQEEGNSEIGHLTIGAGRVVYQPYPKITMAIKDGSFSKNPEILKAFEATKKTNCSLHLIGLFGEANVHSSLEHLKALISFAEKEGLSNNLKLHLITDGRDSEPQAGLKLLPQIPQHKISSLSGRFYAMDRDNHFERTELAFKAMTGATPEKDSPVQVLHDNYQNKISDEYLPPTFIGPEANKIKDGDTIIFFNFREERMKQLVSMAMERLPLSYLLTFTKYDSTFGLPVAFPPEKIINPLGKIISDNGLNQLRLAESEKEAHVTFFFNGQQQEPFPNEYRAIVPSKKIQSYAQLPQMMASEITDRLASAMEEGAYQFILANYANPDMVAHTGDFAATLRAIEVIDSSLKHIIDTALQNGFTLLITADHGNAERLMDPMTGEKETKHNESPVPFYLIAKDLQKTIDTESAESAEREISGSLADIAPTVLELMGVEKPNEMSGESLLSFLT